MIASWSSSFSLSLPSGSLSRPVCHHEKHQKDLGMHLLSIVFVIFSSPASLPQLARRNTQPAQQGAQQEASTSRQGRNSTNGPTPPNNTRPTPSGSTSALANLSTVASSSSPGAASSSNTLQRTSSPNTPSTQERRYSGERASPAPPIVVVSSDPQSEAVPPARNSFASSDRGLQHANDGTPPRNTTLNRLRNSGPKDTIPIVGKPPRKQRSSRFVVTQHVDIERLPSFAGMFLFSHEHCRG